jgi:hypothetical protein
MTDRQNGREEMNGTTTNHAQLKRLRSTPCCIIGGKA